MAGASDKARFHLEQSVPELREWQRKELFTNEELSAVTAKRSDFEHILNARGSKPSDYARYAEYEMNLDALRSKRAKRKGIKTAAHSGQRRIFFILDRATKKFHGDVGLWMQYIEYARSQKANKKLQRILTDALRMHPTRAELWIYAARYAMDVQADMDSVRSYMQRGLRFCKHSKTIYIEYARLEMKYISKIAKRRQILGIDAAQNKMAVQETEQEAEVESDVIALPSDVSEEKDPGHLGKDIDALKDLSSTPAMTGAIPIAIFCAAARQFADDPDLSEEFFNMFAGFIDVPCTRHIIEAVIDQASTVSKSSPAVLSCRCQAVLLGIPHTSADFPPAVGIMIKTLRSGLSVMTAAERAATTKKILPWFARLMEDDVLEPEVKHVLLAVEAQLKHFLF